MDPFQNIMDLDDLHALVISCCICLCNVALGASLRAHCTLQRGSQTWACHQGNLFANRLVFGGKTIPSSFNSFLPQINRRRYESE